MKQKLSKKQLLREAQQQTDALKQLKRLKEMDLKI